jgi:quercetin dioxygenase-like cupin family protein
MNTLHQVMRKMSLQHDSAVDTLARMTIFHSHQERSWRQISPGVEFCYLREHGGPVGHRGGMTILVRMARGADAQLHVHPGGEETYMVSGKLRVGEHHLVAGDYLWTPPGAAHDGHAEEESFFFVVAPGGLKAMDVTP